MIGETILHYKILEKLGEGGMGEVFKAQDTKLDRFVALKFLPSQLTASEDDKARFIQEAKAASSMNHPNVCTIYSIEEYEKQLFIAMEYVEGKTLKDKKDFLSEKQILEIGIQVAEGLAAAHEKGIVHRDIKPENIMVRKDGIAQIMDFGLAKLYSSGNVSRLTKAGTTMGTMGYMSPEQVQGLDVDHRTDIFSLGVVLYEMLAGESPFKGMHETAIMYEIVNVDAPPIMTVKEGIDPELDETILECLEKDKEERCQSAKELAKDLKKIKKSTGHRKSRVYSVNTQTLQVQPGSQAKSKSSGSITIEAFNKKFELGNLFSSKYLSWVLSVILFLAVLYFAMYNKQNQQKQITSATSITAPGNVNILGENCQISHNGESVVFAAIDSTGNWKLWLRPINSTSARVLTELTGSRVNGSLFPFWSYDDKFVLYFYGGKLKKINITSGTQVDICDAIIGRGGSMNKDGDIVFAPNATGGLYIVSSNGGKPREIVKSDTVNSEESLRFPYFLPDGEHFLYSIQARFSGSTPDDQIMVGSINSDEKDTVLQVSSNAQYADGYLFFVRQSILMCQKFDPGNFKLSGDIHTISPNINFFNAYIYAAYSISDEGSIILQTHNENSLQTVLINDKGEKRAIPFTNNIQNTALFSPDGSKIAYDALSSDNKNFDVWIYDIKRQIPTRFTFSPNIEQRPIWSNDGRYIAYLSNKGKVWNILIKRADGTGTDSLVYQSDQAFGPSDWSSDGRYISFTQTNPKTYADIGIIDLKNNNSSQYFLRTEFNEFAGLFSKNMKWIMYGSNESGKSQVYVQPFEGNGGKRQVSSNGGYPLKWVDKDKAIIYVWQNEVLKVKVDASAQNFVIGKPELLFNTADKNIIYLYDVTSDGKTFLGAVSNGSAITPPLTYIQNWQGLINEGNK